MIKTNSIPVAGVDGAAKNRPEKWHDVARLTWSVAEAARRIGIGKTSIYKLAKQGELRLVKIAGRTLVPDSEIARLLGVGGPGEHAGGSSPSGIASNSKNTRA